MSHTKGSDLADERRNAKNSTANPQESPTPTSLREQINKLATGYRKYVQNEAGIYSYATEKKLSKKQFIDSVEALVTTYIKAAEIQAEGRGRTEVLSAFKDWADDVEITYQKLVETELDKINGLQAQKAVLEDK